MPRSPLALGLAKGRSRPINPSRLLNLYAEPTPENSVSPWALYGTPGQKTFATAGSASIRAGREALGYAYVLSGQTVYRIDLNGNATACTGDTPSATGTAMMDDNGVQLGLLVNGRMFYIAAATPTTVTAVTDAQYPADGASSFGFIGGYGAFTKAATDGEWFISALYDFSSFDAADFATAESSPDGLERLLVNHDEVWLFGRKTTEVWGHSGAAGFPFDHIPGSLMDRGIGAPLSAILMDNAPFWLGDDRIVYRANGYTPTRISTFAVEEILRSGTVSDAEASTHAIGGHHFYVLKLPTLDRTLVYDAATSIWHERQTGTAVSPAAWSVNCIFTAFGKTLVGLDDGLIRELDLDTYLDGTTQIRRSLTSFPAYNGRQAILRSMELECERGVGLGTGQGSNPQWMLRFSRDGGETFGNEKWSSFGATGRRRARCMWEQLGRFQNGAVEVSCADPVKIAVYGGNYETEDLR